jgi:hypothetical protein
MAMKQWRNWFTRVFNFAALAAIGVAASFAMAQSDRPAIPSVASPFDQGPSANELPPQREARPPFVQGPLGTPERQSTPPQPTPSPERTIPSFEAPTQPRATPETTPMPGPGTPSTTIEPSTSGPAGRTPGPNPFGAEGTPQPLPGFGAPSTTDQTPPDSGAPSESSPAEQEMTAGVDALNKGLFEEALAHFQAAAKLVPEDTAPLLYEGITYRFMHRYDEAIDAFTAILQPHLDPYDGEALLRRGIAWFY